MAEQQNPVPTIDISGFIDGSDTTSAPRLIKHAAETSGFFQIVGHGIPTQLFDECYRAGDELFHQPRDIQDALVSPTGNPHRGMRTAFDKATGLPVSAGFTIGRFDGPEDARANGVEEQYLSHFDVNVWPDIPGFRDVFDKMREQTREVGKQMMRIYAVALDMPVNYFDDMFVPDTTTSTIRSYPARKNRPLAEDPTVIFDEHFDGGQLTLLHQRGYDGLQIRDPQGDWFTVPTDDSAFVINIGRLMSQWTNGRWPATRHRVIASSDPDAFRYTMPTFYTASAGTVVAPLPTQLGDEGPKYDAITVFDDYRQHLVRLFGEMTHTRYDSANHEFVARMAETSR